MCRISMCSSSFQGLFFAITLVVLSSVVVAQDSRSPGPVVIAPDLMEQLNDLSGLIDRRTKQRDELLDQVAAAGETTPAESERLSALNHDLSKLRESFDLLVLGVGDVDILQDEQEKSTTWQEDLVEVVKPLTDSLKSLTKRPRQIAELRETILTIDQKKVAIDQALLHAASVEEGVLDESAAEQVDDVLAKWRDEKDQLLQEHRIAVAQLSSLTSEKHSPLQGVLPATREFFLGRGMTILLALLAAILTWLLLRLLLWLYTRFFTSKKIRRRSTWFRVLTYSYYLITLFFVIFSVLAVLYVREDLVLLALSFLLIAGAALSLRHFVPRYITEARLLLNLGSVREGERVIYNGLPWQVMSLNLYCVLRNPALEGVIKLPIETISTLVSRPVKSRLWFPTNAKDFIILPDGQLGQLKQQTPDLVEILVEGGMTLTYTTSQFYAMNVINLSREKSFGLSIVCGVKTEIKESGQIVPNTIERAVDSALVQAGYEKHRVELGVELTTATTSSHDYLVFVRLKSEVAGDYYDIRRRLIQTCSDLCAAQNWTLVSLK